MAPTSSTSGADTLKHFFDGPLDRIGRQLQHPSGLAGRLLGHAMELANRRPNREAIAALDIEPDDDILELGFGPGAAIEALAMLAPQGRIFGVDISQTMLELACQRNQMAIRTGRMVLTQGGFDHLPLAGGSVDKILAVNVVYFWHDAETILREVQRVLRPGGLICLYATDAAAMRRWKFAGPETHRTFDRQALAALLQNGGFAADQIVLREIRVLPNIPGWIATARKGP